MMNVGLSTVQNLDPIAAGAARDGITLATLSFECDASGFVTFGGGFGVGQTPETEWDDLILYLFVHQGAAVSGGTVVDGINLRRGGDITVTGGTLVGVPAYANTHAPPHADTPTLPFGCGLQLETGTPYVAELELYTSNPLVSYTHFGQLLGFFATEAPIAGDAGSPLARAAAGIAKARAPKAQDAVVIPKLRRTS